MSTSLTTTALGEHDAAAPPVSTRAKASAICLVGGAVALALGRALTNEGGSPSERLQQVTGHQAQVTAGALLAMIGFAALIPGFLAVAALVRGRGATLASVGAGLTVFGCAAFEALVAVDAFPTVQATHSSSRDAMMDLLHRMDNFPPLALIGPLAAIGYLIGPFLVTLAARRAGWVPSWLPWGVLASLILQPIALGAFGGPGVAKHLVDTLCQLALVVMAALLARATLLPRSAA
jgi:hypothetical protein